MQRDQRKAEQAAAAKQRTLFEQIPSGSTISGIATTTADPDRLSIRIGRRTVARLSREAAQSIGLEVGLEWTHALEARVEEAAATERAVAYAVRLLGRRPLSRRELVQRLASRGFDRKAADAAAEEVVRMGLIDERAYAEAVIRNTTIRRPAGRRLLEAKLRGRGIETEAARRAIESAASESNPLEDATELARKRAATLPESLDGRAASRRLAGLLARRGFDAGVVQEAVRRALAHEAGAEDE